MPRIPIPQQPPLALIDGGAETDGGPAPLPPETAAGLRTLAARTARIDRELAVSQSWLSGHERLARAEDAPQGPPSGFLRSFLEDADRDRETALKTELPDDAKDALGLDLLDLRATFADRAAEMEAEGRALRRRLSLHETLEGYRTGVARDPGLYDGAADRMTALVADLGLPEERRELLTRHATDRLANAAVDGLMGDPERAERLLSEGLFDDALSEGSKALRLKEARDLSSRQRLLARESRVADLAARASDGALAEDALTAAERDGALGPAEAARLRETDRAAVEAAALRDAQIERVAQAADPFDPLDAEDRAAVSAYWDSVSEVHGADDPEAQRRTELAFVDRTGVLPEGLRKRYQGELLSADAAVAATGAETISTLAAKDPALVADVPPAQVRKATIVAGFAALGLPPERAIELADAEMDRDERPPDPETSAIRIAANENGDDSETEVAAPAPDEGEEASGRQPDGSAVIVDPETGDRTTVPPDKVAQFDALVAEHQALADLRADYLDLYDRVAAGEISREEATQLLLDRVTETLPVTNEAGSPIAANRSLRQAFERLATDIFDAPDRDEAGTILADVLAPPDHARDIAELILSFLPVTGEIISAKDAYDGFRAAMAAMEDGRTRDALVDASLAGVSALEVIPLFGRALKLGRGGIRAARTLQQVAAGPRRRLQRAADTDVVKRRPVRHPKEPLSSTSISELDRMTDDAAASPGFKRIRQDKSVRVNKEFPDDWDPLPYRPGTKTVTVRLTKPSVGEFVRVHGVENQKGRWILRKADLFGSRGRRLSAVDLYNKYSLPEVPTEVSDVRIPRGTVLRIGATGSRRGSRSGNVTQYELRERLPDNSFRNRRPLQR